MITFWEVRWYNTYFIIILKMCLRSWCVCDAYLCVRRGWEQEGQTGAGRTTDEGSQVQAPLAFSVLQNTGVYISKNCFWRFLEKMKNMTWMLSLFILFHTFPEKSFSSPKTYFFPKKNSLCSPIQRINPSLCSPIQQINPSLCSPIQRINPSLCSPIQRINP